MAIQHKNHRRSGCHLHPSTISSSGSFCTSCLRERLEGIGPSTLQEIPNYSIPRQDSLRRSKSYSAARHEGDLPEFRRRSCHARCRESLSDLLGQDGGRKFLKGGLLSRLREEDENEIEEARHNGRGSFAIGRGFDDDFGGVVELKTMKEFIDLEWQSKKQKKKDIRVLWEAASAFSKKLIKLRRKDKVNSQGGSIGDLVEPAKDVKSKNLRETQFEVGEYGGLGRRSCDTDPRFSLDASRFSVDDDMRCPFDKPRASWDGYLLSGTGRTYHNHLHHRHHHERFNSMASFSEEIMVDEKLNVVNEEERSPGGSVQTRDYYKEPLITQRRRRSFERSNSQRRGALLEVDELKLMLNAKVSPATNELFYDGAKLLIAERKLMGSNSNNLKDECLESVESNPRGTEADVGGADVKGIKKLPKWGNVWNIGGIMQRLKQVSNGELAIGAGNASKVAVSNHGFGNIEDKGPGARMRENGVLQRNQSVKHSPSNLDHGLLRFHLAPSPRNSVKSRLRQAHSLSKGVI